MAKFHGLIGFGETTETRPGVWEEKITERAYTGEVLSYSRRWQQSQGVNDDLSLSNRFSILADPFAYNHFHQMRYIKWMGAAWKISEVDVQYPRLLLSIGGVYNGETLGAPCETHRSDE